MPPYLKEFIKRLPFFPRFHSFWRFHITGHTKNDPTELIRRYLRNKSPYVVQIGSNDGKTNDPIFPLFTERWHGLFVEPLPHLMEKLKKNYRFSENVEFQECVINDGSDACFYYIDPNILIEHPDLPHWVDQLGSLNSDHIYLLPELVETLMPYRREVRVQGMTFETLMRKHNVQRIDILHIDAEGFDWKILSQVNFTEFTPRIVLYEHRCLSELDRTESIAFMSQYYWVRDLGADIFCLRR